ncbi:hypothetical protein IJ674_04645 [bacterium]|nr:hypothetical protein [bacterium]
MAQDIERIISLLNDMQKSNDTNADSFDRLLTSINSKLNMTNLDTNADLFKAYINELALSVDEKYTQTLNKFEDIEKALKAVYNSQDDHVKNDDMKELFDVFSKNVNNFYTEARQEKAILAGIETKLNDIATNKTDKEDILRTISLLRNDLGNVNHSYKNTIDDINTTLKTVLASIKGLDPLKSGETAKAQIDIIYNATNNIINLLNEIESKEDNLEKILNNVATNEDLKITKGIIDSIFEKTNVIEERLNSNVQKDDLDKFQHTLENINKKTAQNINKEEFELVQKQTENILTQTDEIKQTLSKVAQNIEKCPDASELERSLSELFVQVDNLTGIINSNNDINHTDINTELNSFKEELDVIQNIVTDLNEALTTRILNDIDSVTNSQNELKNIVSEILGNIPTQDKIESILQNGQVLEEINKKTNEISKQLEVLPKIQEDVEDITLKLPNIDVSNEIANIYSKTNSIENWLIASNIKENSEKIATQIENTSTSDEIAQVQYTTNEIISVLEKLTQSYDSEQINESIEGIGAKLNEVISAIEGNISDSEDSAIYEKLTDIERSISEISTKDDYSNDDEFNQLHDKFAQLQDAIEDLKLDIQKQVSDNQKNIEDNITSVSEFIKNNTLANNEYIKEELNTIKSLIEANSSDFDNISETENQDLIYVKEYLNDIKDLLQDTPKSGLYSKIISLEDSLVNNQTFNESAFSQIIDKINGIKFDKPATEDSAQIEQAMSEINSLKEQIETLTASFDNKDIDLDLDNPEELYVSKIEDFISDKLKEISTNVSEIANTSDKKITEGFAYQTELLEQKTVQLQKLISEIELNNNIDNPALNEKLSDANETLGDFRQELQLVSTDITENISKQTKDILKELEPIKEILENMYNNSNPATLKNEVEELNNSLLSAPELADLSADIEDLYGRLTEKFTENENNLKDFILTDTDSIIIKLDNLRDYVEKSLDAIVPPDAGSMKELQDFAADIKDFKESQVNLIIKSVDEIKHEIKAQSDEIKSMLTIANNNDQILEAIEELKKTFKAKSSKKKSKPDNEDAEVLASVDFSQDSLDELKNEFTKYSKQIDILSDNNKQITGVLESISQKLENISLPPISNSNAANTTEGEELEDDDFEVSEDDIFGEDKFDFVQAFDILQNDIRNLKDTVEEVKKSSNDKETSKIPSINNSGVVMSINSKVDEVLKTLNNNWLSDIEKYIKTGNIAVNSKLDSIESKLDVFVSDTTNTDILNEVSDTLADVNDSVSEIAPKIEDMGTKIEDITPKIEALGPAIEEKLTENDKKLSSMLEELNDKITQIGDNDNSIEELNSIKTLIGEQKTYIEELEPNEKLEAFKKCLDEISFEVNALAADSNADSEKLSKTIKEMKESLMSAVVTIFDQVSFVEETEDIKDFVEERTDEINKNIAQITKQLHQITSSDESNDYTYSMQDIETDLAKLRLALQDSQQVDLTEITDKLHSITSSVDSLTQDEMKELKSEISNLKEQTEFLIATSDKSYNALNSGFEGFGEKISDNISVKVDGLSKMLENSAQSDSVVRQALIYIGEWIDSATTSINKISTNSDEISRINEVLNGIEDLKTSVHTQVNNTIEEKFEIRNNQIESIEEKFEVLGSQIKSLEKQFNKVENLENQLMQQQERIDRLEMSIDKLLSIVENLDDPGITRKMDKIEKQLSKLGTNVEKLASYVD